MRSLLLGFFLLTGCGGMSQNVAMPVGETEWVDTLEWLTARFANASAFDRDGDGYLRDAEFSAFMTSLMFEAANRWAVPAGE